MTDKLTDFLINGLLDWTFLGILGVTWVLTHNAKALVAKMPPAKRRSGTVLISFIIGFVMTIWYKWGDPNVYEIAFAIGVLNPTAYTLFVTVILSKIAPDFANSLKKHK